MEATYENIYLDFLNEDVGFNEEFKIKSIELVSKISTATGEKLLLFDVIVEIGINTDKLSLTRTAIQYDKWLYGEKLRIL